MTARAPRLGWVPPFLVGAASAIAAEVAISMLLYGGPGLVRSLTAVLAVEALAFAAGLWSAPSPGADLVDRVRHRWIFGLTAFLVAAAFSAAWTFVPILGEGRAGQTLGLTLLAALPLYASGTVLGGIAVAASTDAGGRLRGPGAAAASGAAIGFVLTGFLLPRVPLPGTMLVGCLILLSLAGMVYGAVLGVRTEVNELARRPMPTGDVRVRERRVEVADLEQIELVEAGVVRRSRPIGDREASVPWDVVSVRATLPASEAAWRILILGGGASSAPKAALREHPNVEVDVAERAAAVLELGREYFDTGLSLGSGDRVAVAAGNLDDLVGSIRTTYDVLLLDLRALAPLGGLRGLSRATRWRLFDALSEGGVVVIGPDLLDPLPPELDRWTVVPMRRPDDGAVVTIAVKAEVPEGLLSGFEGFVPG